MIPRSRKPDRAIALCAEAVKCRRQALSYLGRPEAPFLLRAADEFERLAGIANDAG
jgi:hypothetical protein